MTVISACQFEKTNYATHTNQTAEQQNKQKEDLTKNKIEASNEDLIHAVQTKYQTANPTRWGERMPGIISKLPTNDKVIALTLDACGGKNGSGYDTELIQFLQQNQIPATLFLNARWIQSHPELTKQLSDDPLFEIENHGSEHRPLSVNGRTIYGIQGTKSVDQVIQEVMTNHHLIKQVTGKPPRFFRSGTAYYDEIAIQITNQLGEQIAGFDITGDAGATFNKTQVKNAMLQVQPGSIVLLHMNMPQSETAEGLKEAIPLLKKQGYRFVKMDQSIPSSPSKGTT